MIRKGTKFYGIVHQSLQVALLSSVYVVLRVLFNPPLEVYMATTIAGAIILFPVTYRLSRTIHFNFFIRYKPEHDHSIHV